MNQAIFNPWAPPYLNGFNDTAPDGCKEEDAAYIWPTGGDLYTFSARQVLSGQSLVLEQEDEFVWRALQWTISGNILPGFLYRVQDENGNWICDDLMMLYNTPGTFANPWPQFPHVTYRRGQQIKFDIVNTSTEEQSLQLVFRGAKRYWNG